MPSSISTLRRVGVPSSSIVSEPRRWSIAPSSITVTPGAATRSPMRPEKADVPLRLKSPSRPWPTASCSSTPGQPGPSTTGISPAGAATEFEVGQRLRQRDVDRPAPLRLVEQIVVEIAAAEAVIAGFPAAVLLGDDLHAEPDQRAHVGGDEAVGANDVDDAPARREADADLGDARIAGARRGVDPLAQRDLVGERHEAERIVGAVHRLVGPRGGDAAGSALCRIEQLERRGGALDRRLADLIGVGEGGGLAGHAAQAEAGRGVIVGGLQPAVVEAERFAGAVLKVELAVVVPRRGACAASRRGARRGRGCGRGTGADRARSCRLGVRRSPDVGRSGGRNSRTRRSPCSGVDPQETRADGRAPAKSRPTVAGDLNRGDPDDFGRLDGLHGQGGSNRALRFNAALRSQL